LKNEGQADVAGDSESVEYYRDWIRRAADVCECAARGDLEPRVLHIPDGAEVGRLLNGINGFLDMTDAFVRESGACLNAAAGGKFFRRILVRGMLGSFRQSACVANSATAQMAQQAEALSDLERKRNRLADELAEVISAISNSASEVRSTADALATGAHKTSNIAIEVSSAAVDMSKSVQSVASAAEQLNASFGEVERQTRESEKFAQSAVEDTQRTSQTMDGLSEASQRIGGVVKLITHIATQTRLLALNAAIEAARSGEAGRGFAVVAAEVKNLALQTAEAMEGITTEVHRIQRTSGEVANGIQNIGERINLINGISSGIAQSITEQRHATGEISRSVHKAADNTQSVSLQVSGVRETAVAAGKHASALVGFASALSIQSEQLDTALRSLLAVAGK